MSSKSDYFCDEDVLGHVFGSKAVAADSGAGASQVAWFPEFVQGAEGVGDILRELGTGGRVESIGAMATSRGRYKR
jgi:hypothetical protein